MLPTMDAALPADRRRRGCLKIITVLIRGRARLSRTSESLEELLRLSRGVLAVEHVPCDDERIDVALNNDLFKPPENFVVLVFAREPAQRLTGMPISRVKDTYHGN